MESDGAIPELECWSLLARASLGYIAATARALPVVLPVQYSLDGDSLVICLGHYRLPEPALSESVIAFVAAQFDPITSSGWSVHVLGISKRSGADCEGPSAGDVIRLRPQRIEGHWMHMCPLLGEELYRTSR